MNLKAFFVDALTSALEGGIGTAEDVVRHVTPDLLAEHLPRPLWARLLTACIGAPRVDAQLIVETLGVSNLCEHMPSTVIWSCLAELGHRALGGVVAARPAATAQAPAPAVPVEPAAPLSIDSPPDVKPTPPPSAPPSVKGPSIPAPGAQPLADLVAELEGETPRRGRTPTSQRFRQTNTNINRLAASSRRPQASVPTPEPEAAERPRPRRAETEVEVEVETDVGGAQDWRNSLAVEDEQLVDWAASEETLTSDIDDRRKR